MLAYILYCYIIYVWNSLPAALFEIPGQL